MESFTQEEQVEQIDKKVMPKPKKERCFHCKKKLKMTELNFLCKCDHKFCQFHLNPHSHMCSFDYLKERRIMINKSNPKMCVQAIEVK
jgi:hypothetical protein